MTYYKGAPFGKFPLRTPSKRATDVEGRQGINARTHVRFLIIYF